jgi:hypothetical protein
MTAIQRLRALCSGFRTSSLPKGGLGKCAGSGQGMLGFDEGESSSDIRLPSERRTPVRFTRGARRLDLWPFSWTRRPGGAVTPVPINRFPSKRNSVGKEQSVEPLALVE